MRRVKIYLLTPSLAHILQHDDMQLIVNYGCSSVSIRLTRNDASIDRSTNKLLQL